MWTTAVNSIRVPSSVDASSMASGLSIARPRRRVLAAISRAGTDSPFCAQHASAPTLPDGARSMSARAGGSAVVCFAPTTACRAKTGATAAGHQQRIGFRAPRDGYGWHARLAVVWLIHALRRPTHGGADAFRVRKPALRMVRALQDDLQRALAGSPPRHAWGLVRSAQGLTTAVRGSHARDHYGKPVAVRAADRATRTSQPYATVREPVTPAALPASTALNVLAQVAAVLRTLAGVARVGGGGSIPRPI